MGLKKESEEDPLEREKRRLPQPDVRPYASRKAYPMHERQNSRTDGKKGQKTSVQAKVSTTVPSVTPTPSYSTSSYKKRRGPNKNTRTRERKGIFPHLYLQNAQ